MTQYLREWKEDCIDDITFRTDILEHIGDDHQHLQASATEVAEICAEGMMGDLSDLDPIGRCAQTACKIVLYGNATGDLARATFDSVRRHTWALELMSCVIADFRTNAHGYFVELLGNPQPRMHAAKAGRRHAGEKHPQIAKQSALAVYAMSNAREARVRSESKTGEGADEVVGSHDLETAKEGVRTTRSKKPKQAALATGSCSSGGAGSIASALGPDAGEYGVRVTRSMDAVKKPVQAARSGLLVDDDEVDEDPNLGTDKASATASGGWKRSLSNGASQSTKRSKRKLSPLRDDIPAHDEIPEQFRRPASYQEPPADNVTELRSQLGQLKSRHNAACRDWGFKNDQKRAELEYWKKKADEFEDQYRHIVKEGVVVNTADVNGGVEAVKAQTEAQKMTGEAQKRMGEAQELVAEAQKMAQTQKTRADIAENKLKTAEAGISLFKTELAMSKQKFSIFSKKPEKGTTSIVNQDGNAALTTEIASLQAQKADLESQLAAQKTGFEAQLKARVTKATKEKQHDLATISLLSGIAQRESDKVDAQAYDDEWIGARIYINRSNRQLEQVLEARNEFLHSRGKMYEERFGKHMKEVKELRKEVYDLKVKSGEIVPVNPYARSANLQKGKK